MVKAPGGGIKGEKGNVKTPSMFRRLVHSRLCGGLFQIVFVFLVPSSFPATLYSLLAHLIPSNSGIS